MRTELNLRQFAKPTSVAMVASPLVTTMSKNDVAAMMGGVQMTQAQPSQDTVSFSGCCGN